jgi:RecB family exonuclease
MTKNEILQSIQLRQSTIKDYLNCPLMFRFKHLDKISPEYRNTGALHGSTLHKLLYIIHLDKWNLDVTRYYRDIFEFFEIENGNESLVPVKWENREKELAAFEENAIEILDGYRNRSDNREALILYSEQTFRVKIAGYIFTGTIDQVRENPDTSIELIDFKSGKQQPSPVAIHNDWQLSLYQYALEHGEFEISGEWFFPDIKADYSSIYFLRNHEIRKRSSSNGPAGTEKGEPLMRSQRDDQQLRMFKSQIRRLLNSMLKDWHYPNTNHCHICQYTNHCVNRHNELPTKLATEARKRLKEVELVS